MDYSHNSTGVWPKIRSRVWRRKNALLFFFFFRGIDGGQDTVREAINRLRSVQIEYLMANRGKP